MTHRELQSLGHVHHYAVFHMTDGTQVSGFMQAYNDEFVYLTLDENGKAGGKLKLAEIRSVEFPRD